MDYLLNRLSCILGKRWGNVLNLIINGLPSKLDFEDDDFGDEGFEF